MAPQNKEIKIFKASAIKDVSLDDNRKLEIFVRDISDPIRRMNDYLQQLDKEIALLKYEINISLNEYNNIKNSL